MRCIKSTYIHIPNGESEATYILRSSNQILPKLWHGLLHQPTIRRRVPPPLILNIDIVASLDLDSWSIPIIIASIPISISVSVPIRLSIQDIPRIPSIVTVIAVAVVVIVVIPSHLRRLRSSIIIQLHLQDVGVLGPLRVS